VKNNNDPSSAYPWFHSNETNSQNIMNSLIQYNNVDQPPRLQKESAADLVPGFANCQGKIVQISSPGR